MIQLTPARARDRFGIGQDLCGRQARWSPSRAAPGMERIPSPRPINPPSRGERNGNREADRADCVRIVHKHRNLLAHAPEALHEEVSADYTDMVSAATPQEIAARRRAFLRKWRPKCRAVADSLEEAGEGLFAFTRLPPGQWKSARTTNAIERLHEELRRRIETQTVLPSAETAAMPFWALLASGQISMRKVDGWQSLGQPPAKSMIDLAA